MCEDSVTITKQLTPWPLFSDRHYKLGVMKTMKTLISSSRSFVCSGSPRGFRKDEMGMESPSEVRLQSSYCFSARAMSSFFLTVDNKMLQWNDFGYIRHIVWHFMYISSWSINMSCTWVDVNCSKDSISFAMSSP